ncbi:pyridoxamine 5'-phosphate oxidase family protein [Jatrophihabitans sp.]|uniref:pyridoxamine 5'-phosphate oxidase family protein n=1 Tax=Jatrophihabitans sp. TaxID=1932789 RepID=UPI002BD93BD7|nr:pyridoxamine 5'-phosphate oxidase family protein [Jatrophihabitans sp.]
MNVYDGIDDKLAAWLTSQPVFFVATAPLAADGHVNVSPKGMAGTFVVFDSHRVGYLDYYGSGAETIAHLRENGRITLMFAAFTGRPTIVRLSGTGRIVLTQDPEFAELRPAFAKQRTTAQRAIVLVDLDRVSDSCGYAVPLMDFAAHRDVLDLRQEKKGPAVYREYPETKNAVSIDGLPALGDLGDRTREPLAPPAD